MAMVRRRKRKSNRVAHHQCTKMNPGSDVEVPVRKLGPFKQVPHRLKNKRKKIYLIESCNSSTFNISQEIF